MLNIYFKYQTNDTVFTRILQKSFNKLHSRFTFKHGWVCNSIIDLFAFQNIAMNDLIFSEFPLLESERMFFKNYADASPEVIYEIRSNKKINEFLDREPAHSIEDAIKHIKIVHRAFEEKAGVNWVLIEKAGNKLVGYIGLWRFIKEHNRAEIGYVLLPNYWGKGLMKEAIDTVVRFGFTKMEIHSIEANVNPQNIKSINLLEKCGFKKEAYFRENYLHKGKYLDSVIYSLLEKDLS